MVGRTDGTMNGGMDGWVDGWTNGQTDGWVDMAMHGRTKSGQTIITCLSRTGVV